MANIAIFAEISGHPPDQISLIRARAESIQRASHIPLLDSDAELLTKLSRKI